MKNIYPIFLFKPESSILCRMLFCVPSVQEEKAKPYARKEEKERSPWQGPGPLHPLSPHRVAVSSVQRQQ